MTRLERWWCAVRGHDSVMAFESDRMLMRCSSCGHDSPGIYVRGLAPRRTHPGDPAKLHLSGLRLTPRRRSA